MGIWTPTAFNPVISDDSAAFSEQAVAAMEKELSKLSLHRRSPSYWNKSLTIKILLRVKRSNNVRL